MSMDFLLGFAKEAGSLRVSRAAGNILIEGAGGAFARLTGYAKGNRIKGKDRILDHIHVPESERGKGVGSEILRMITGHADKRRQTVRLNPIATGDAEFGGGVKMLPQEDLEKWYGRHGFEKAVDGPKKWTTMTRKPK